MATRGEFSKELLRELDAPVSKRNLWALVSWMQAEGGEALSNPLNSTLDWKGASDYNWVHVKNYATFEDGVAATVETLNYGADRHLYGYAPIRKRLVTSAFAYWTLRAVESSDWGTGGLALRCLPWVKKSYESYARKEIAS